MEVLLFVQPKWYGFQANLIPVSTKTSGSRENLIQRMESIEKVAGLIIMV